MEVRRLTSVNDVVKNWTFLASGLAAVGHHLRYQLTSEAFRKTLFTLSRQTHCSWLGIAYDSGDPVAFIVAHETTPLFSDYRELDVSLYYHTPGNAVAITHLQRELDDFCTKHSFKRYNVTTRHKAGRPLPVFSIGWSGVHHAYRVYQKEFNS